MAHSFLTSVGTVAVVGIVSSAAWAASDDGPPPIFDKRPYDEARKAAEEGKKWFIVKATAVWCLPCKKMDRTTWRDENVVKWLSANALAVEFDVDKDKKLAKDLTVEAMPTMIAFKDGKEFDRIVGYKPPDEFLAWLEGLARGEKSIEAVRKRAGARDGADGKVDVKARLELARTLARTNKPDEATDEFVWLWQHMLEYDEAYYGVRVSFMASDMQRLAAKDAGAKKKFTELRDRAAKDIAGDRIDPEDIVDWVTLNGIVGDTKATLAWYDKVKDQRRWLPLVNRVSRDLQDLLIAEKRWADVGRLYGNPIEELDREHEIYAMTPKHDLPADFPAEQRKRIEDLPNQMLRDKARVMYAGLLAAGREADAEKLAARAREFDGSPAMLAALVSTALDANQPRAQQLEWIDKCSPPDSTSTELRAKVQSALEKKK